MFIGDQAYELLDDLINSNRWDWGSPVMSVILWILLTILNSPMVEFAD